MKWLSALILSAVITGCTTSYRVYVSGLGQSTPEMRRYVLLPAAADITVHDLQFQEFARYIHVSLATQEYEPVDEVAQADVVLFMHYGIGNPQQVTSTYPIIGKTGGGTSTFSGTVYGTGGSAQASGTVTKKPQYGVVGTGAATKTRYTRHLILEAVDARHYLRTEEIMPVWKTTVTSTGKTGDIRRVFPVLVTAAEPYWGKNTGQQVGMWLSGYDPKVDKMKARFQDYGK